MPDPSTLDLGILAAGAIIGGIYLLTLGGGWTITAAIAVAERARLSRMFIGATIVAFGTSVPELFTSVNANLQGEPDIALGNVVGSNVANILLVIGAAALVCPLAARRRTVARDLALMLVATAILVAGMLYGVFTTWMGAGMFALLVAFVVWQYLRREIDVSEVEEVEMSVPAAALRLLAGIGALLIGSELLIRGAVVAGGVLGVPDAVIGLTAVAVGTSLPELTASVAAAARRETDLIFGNIIGSNAFNILSIVALTAVIKPLAVDPELLGVELWVMAGAAAGFAALLMAGVTITRPLGVAFLAAYAAFTLYLFRGLAGA